MVKVNIEYPSDFLKSEYYENGVYVSVKQKELWLILLDLYNEIKKVCDKWDIKYTSHAGTLLGCIRGGGFIKWDDDFDICMTRNEYNKLLEHSDEFKYPYYFEKPLDKNYRFFSKLKRLDTTYLTKPGILNNFDNRNNIFLDVFPFDNILGESEEEIEEELLELKEHYKEYNKVYNGFKNGLISYNDFIIEYKKYDDLIQQHKDKKTKFTFINCFNHFEQKLKRNSEDFEEQEYRKFEFIEIPCCKNYERYLSTQFGENWRTPIQCSSYHQTIYYNTNELKTLNYIKFNNQDKIDLGLNIDVPSNFYEEEVRNDFIITTKRKQLWGILLDILNELGRVCNKYGINYYSDGGTQLGVLRHKGFVPWDDDIDIMMLRKDFDLLVQHLDEFKDPYIIKYNTNGYMINKLLIGRKDTTILSYNTLDKTKLTNHNIIIDILPFDNMIDDYNECQKIKNEILSLRLNYNKVYEKYSFKRIDKEEYDEQSKIIDKKMYELITQFNDQDTPLIGDWFISGFGETYNNETQFHKWTRYKEDNVCLGGMMDFEFMKIPVINGSQNNVIREYGENWMTPIKNIQYHNLEIVDTTMDYTIFYKKYNDILNEMIQRNFNE